MRRAPRCAPAVLLVLLLGIANTGAQECVPCEEGTWCFENYKFSCGQHETSLNTSDSVSDCICVDGYARGADGVCALCNATEVCAGGVVTSCPTNSLAASGSWDLAQCVCVPGHERVAGVCVPCSAGFFKTTSGDGACTACAIGAFAGGGATACEPCAVGNSTTTGAAASHADCVCRAGFYGDASSTAGACAACPRGTFLTTAGAATVDACVDCAAQGGVTSTVVSEAAARRLLSAVVVEPLPTHSDSLYYSTVEGASSADVCALCPEFSRVVNASGASGGNVSDCVCFEGHRRDAAGVCVKCAPGTFKNTTGPDACTMCPEDTYNHRTGSFAASACTSCPFTLGSLPGAGDILECRCPPGEEGTPETGCTACANGTVQPFSLLDYRDNTATAIGCTPCPEGTYGSNGLTCTACPLNSSALEGSASLENCSCARGLTLSRLSLTCVACEVGTFKNTVSNAPCTWCAANTYGPSIGMSTCIPCPTGATSSVRSTSVFNCTCGAGLRTDLATATLVEGRDVVGGLRCAPCPLNISALAPRVLAHFASAKDASAGIVSERSVLLRECQGCVAGTYAVNGACVACPVNSTGPANASSVSQCECAPGYQRQIIDGLISCEPCPAGSARGEGRAACAACSPGSYSPVAGAAACIKCAAGSFQGQTGATACVSCGANAGGVVQGSVSARTCLCLPGFAPAGEACEPCAAGFYDPMAVMANMSCEECPTTLVTSAGAIGAAACAECPAGSMFGGREHGCRACAPGTRVVDGAARDCECGPGYFGRVVTGTQPLQCEECVPGSFKAGFGNTPCTVCPAGTVGRELTAWTRRDSAETACVACAADQYRLNATACRQCPSNSARLPNANATRADCVCLPGYELVLGQCAPCRAGKYKASHSSSLQCTACPHGKYLPRNGATSAVSCVDCPANSTQVGTAERNSVHTCSCAPGTVPRRTTFSLECEPCAVGTFSLTHDAAGCEACPVDNFYSSASARAEDLCTPCPGNSTAPAGSVLVSACICLPGWRRSYESGSMQCVECGAGAYCPDGLQHVQCPPHAGTGNTTMAFSVAQCVCAAGYYRQIDAAGMQCVLCPAGSFCKNDTRFSCPPNSNTRTLPGQSSLSACACEPGFERNTSITSITDVVRGGPPLCTECPSGTFCASGVRTECPANSTGVSRATSVAQCLCDFGFVRAGTEASGIECVPCNSSVICQKPVLSVRAIVRQVRTDIVTNVRAATEVVQARLGARVDAWTVRSRSNVTQNVTMQLTGSLAWSSTALSAGWLRASHTNVATNLSMALLATRVQFSVEHASMSESSMLALMHEKLTVYLRTLQAGFFTLYTDSTAPYTGTVVVHLEKLGSTNFQASQFATLVAGAGVVVGAGEVFVSARFSETDARFERSATGLAIDGVQLAGLEEASVQILRDMITTTTLRRLLTSDDVTVTQETTSSVDASTTDTTDTSVDTLAGSETTTSLDTSSAEITVTSTEVASSPPIVCAFGAAVASGSDVCMCAPGFKCSNVGANGCVGSDMCQACDETELCVNNFATPCQPNSRVAADEATTGTVRACRCDEGYYRDPFDGVDSYSCVACPAGSYCTGERQFACNALDTNLDLSSSLASTSLHCFCGEGYFQMAPGDKCKPCPKNFYCPGAANFVALNVYACQPFAFTEFEASTNKNDDCQCRAGYKVDSTSVETCMPCQGQELCSASPDVGDVNCPESNGIQTVPNTEHTSCMCPAGAFLHYESQECGYCLEGTYKAHVGNDNTCTACEEGKYAIDANGVQIWDTARFTGGVQCVSCGTGMQMTQGSDGIFVCVCAENHDRDSSSVCVPCADNEYFHPFTSTSLVQTRGALGACNVCPSRSTAIKPGNTSFDGYGMRKQCDCGIGETLSATLGSTETEEFAICESCPSAHYEASRDQCLECPDGMQSAPYPQSYEIREGCVCNTLTRYDERERLGCWHGSWIRLDDDSISKLGWSRDSLAVHQLTPYAETSDDAPPTCSNNCPTRPSSLFCEACAAGSARDGEALQECVLCERNQYQEQTQQASCLTCPPGEITVEQGSTSADACVCPAGYTRRASDQTCVACARGTFKAESGDGPCTECGVGEYQTLFGQTSCNTCPTPRTTENVGTQYESGCVCPVGEYEDASQNCVPCACGSYKDTPGNEACHKCGGGDGALHFYYGDCTVPVDRVDHCVRCPADSGQDPALVNSGQFVMDNVEDCKCFPGFETRVDETGADGSKCVTCEDFKFKTGYGDTGCSHCTTAEYFRGNNLACGSCMYRQWGQPGTAEYEHRQAYNSDPAVGHVWAESEDDCRCKLGFEVWVDGTDKLCAPCGFGKFQADLSVRTCDACPENTYQNEYAQSSCKGCGTDQISAPGSTLPTACSCPGGQESDDTNPLQCVACPAGKAKAAPTDFIVRQCYDCHDGTYQSQTGQLACSSCLDVGALATSIAGAPRDRKESCRCPDLQAFTSTDQGCVPCPQGSYRIFRNLDNVPSWAAVADLKANLCQVCPDRRSTTSNGKGARADCLAAAGFQPSASEGGNRNERQCVPCAKGFYKARISDDDCVACSTVPESGTTDNEQSTSFDDCQCDANAGYYEQP